MTTTARERQPGLRLHLAAAFLGVLIALETMAAMAFNAPVVKSLGGLTATATGALANLTGVPAAVFGQDVFLPTRVLSVNTECTGLFLLLAFVALVLCSPAAPWSKLRGLLVGGPVILGANMVRLLLVVHISGNDGAAFGILHDYLFQAGMLLVVLAVWGA